METYNIQFYADKKDNYSNKFCSFQVKDKTEAFRILLHFHVRKNTFRAIYFRTVLSAPGFTSWDSEECFSFFNFFAQYNSDHNPTFREAMNDFKMYLL